MNLKLFHVTIFFLFSYVVKYNSAKQIELSIHGETKSKTNDKYLSVALDTIMVAEKFENFNMT